MRRSQPSGSAARSCDDRMARIVERHDQIAARLEQAREPGEAPVDLGGMGEVIQRRVRDHGVERGGREGQCTHVGAHAQSAGMTLLRERHDACLAIDADHLCGSCCGEREKAVGAASSKRSVLSSRRAAAGEATHQAGRDSRRRCANAGSTCEPETRSFRRPGRSPRLCDHLMPAERARARLGSGRSRFTDREVEREILGIGAVVVAENGCSSGAPIARIACAATSYPNEAPL